MRKLPHKIFSMLLVALLLASILPTAVFAATPLKISASRVEKELKAGDTVDVDVTLSDNPGITGGTVGITFEASKLKLVGVKNTNATITSTYTGYTGFPITTGTYKLAWSGGLLPADITANGQIATLTFEVLATATAGESPITITQLDFTNRNSHHPNISPVIGGYKQPSKSAQSIEITGFIEKSKPSQIIFLYTLLPLTA